MPGVTTWPKTRAENGRKTMSLERGNRRDQGHLFT